MSTNQARFGDFVKDKRREKKITLKVMAKKLNLSVPYLSDIEKNRRNPAIDKIEELIRMLDLSAEEQELLNDLAGKARNEVSPDLLEYIMDSEVSPYLRTALRKAKQNAATIEDWKRIIEELGRMK